ncbi:lipid IV(A) 3-deoxy-D-manno-octulosonic acid transferase [Lacisediminimonas profundi]|uniref:lipid IV(A) 3-deoxy-D-manno-octulosonic acid transferase n=1 Tax=Lacisediminimonas profundi TaxID=2603856 RepID=UPI00124BC1DA|nr:lipid IV(A) 3-deoxy-D-manno-octulosonic acid transferase [Lacisediminimonas profundi]
MIARTLYSLAWHLALPAVLLRLWWRGRREPGYRQHVGERFGWYGGRDNAQDAPPASGRTIWIHAVSVGETRAAQPLVEAVLQAWPDCRVLLTHMTPTGRATGAALFAGQAGRVQQSYLPYDIGWIAARFLRRFRPGICVLMETEVWPNLLHQCVRHGVPVALVNARLSARSLERAQRLESLMGPAAREISLVAAQTDADARRIAELGVTQVSVVGSVKFDVVVPEAMMQRAGELRAAMQAQRVLLCASTREGEEALILDAWAAAVPENVRLVIVPRHPQRFDDVARLVEQRGLRVFRRSGAGRESMRGAAGETVFLGDSMGEMFAYYGACDVAFVGGSLLPLGGQNLIEPCAVGKPVLVGPHTFNFATITEEAITAGAAIRCDDAGQMLAQAVRLLSDPEAQTAMGQRALDFARHHRGATQRTLALLRPLVEAAPDARA